MPSSRLRRGRARRRFASGCIALVFAGLLAFTLPVTAFAHSRLLASSPTAGASLDRSPTEVSLLLSEEIGVQFSALKILNQTSVEQPVGALEKPGADGNRIRALITRPLAPGTYTVLWRVVSAVDGHLTAGTYAFRVIGAGGAPGQGEAGSPPTPLAGYTDETLDAGPDGSNPLRWLLRGLILASAALLTGGSLFSVLVTEPSSEERGEAGELVEAAVGARFARLGVVTAAILLVALVADLFVQVGVIGQTGFLAAFGRADLASLLLSSTRYGFAWGMKAVAAVILLGLFAWLCRQTRGRKVATGGLWEVSIAAGSFLLLAEALSSHGAAIEADRVLGLPIPLVSDWLHLVTAATWAGGLAYMAAVLFPCFWALRLSPEGIRAYLARSVPRFSRLALGSVLVLTITGVYNLAVHSTNLASIAGSLYGRVLGLKVAIFAALVALGAVNLIRLSPALLRGRGNRAQATAKIMDPSRSLGRNVRAELGLVLVVLVCAGALTLLPPPVGARTTYSVEAADSSDPGGSAPPVGYGPVEATSEEGGYRIVLGIMYSGDEDQLTLAVTPTLATSTPLTDVRKVLFTVAPQDLQAGTSTYSATLLSEVGSAAPVWRASGQVFTLAGSYLLTAVIQRNAQRDVKAAYRLTLSDAGSLIVTAEPYVELRVSTDPSPLVVGQTLVSAEAINSAGQTAPGARISLSAHRSVSPVEGTPVPMQASSAEGSASARINFATPGAWLLLFTVERAGLPATRFEVSLDVTAQ